MMRKLLFAILVICFGWAPFGAHADKMVNVEYIHKLIEQRWGITIPYSPKLSTPKVAANMKYLLTLVDMTNRRINGTATTDYGNGEYATMVAADTVATNRAVATLVKIKPKFTITTTPDTSEFKFQTSAAGRFMVDWGDNTATEIVRDDTNQKTYSHTYKKPGEYKIKMTGLATKYSIDGGSAISFRYNKNVAGISGSLGAIFPTIGNPTIWWSDHQPRFLYTFCDCANLQGNIPPELFRGIHGAPVSNMFYETFYNCSGLSGPIPPKLFGDLSGAPAVAMFHYTFMGCRGLTGQIPADLFVGIKGKPAKNMFINTFGKCSNLSGEIPAGLFGEISGPAAENMYANTFSSCKNLSGCVPDGLFGDVGMTMDEILAEYKPFNGSGVAPEYCSVLEPKFTVTTTADTSEFKFDMSARGVFKIDWGDGKSEVINRTNTTNATYSHEYDAPGEYQIGIGGYATGYSTGTNVAAISFAGTTDAPNTSVAGISGSLGAIFGTIGDGTESGQQPRFLNTFFNCTDLAGTIPPELFAGIHGAPVSSMFNGVFRKCSALTGSIPAGLFAGLDGEPAYYMFYSAFGGCHGLGGEIPADMFGKIKGAPNNSMYRSVFDGCDGLTGEIPAGLFGEISGAPAPSMYESTFRGCSGLTGGIPDGLFGELSGAPAGDMFYATFWDCTGLTGSIPAGLFGNLSGAPAKEMFAYTFHNCHKLTGSIPAGLFGNLSGDPADGMFSNTFAVCAGLTGCVPDGLFGNVGMTLDEIIDRYAPFRVTKITPEYCSVE